MGPWRGMSFSPLVLSFPFVRMVVFTLSLYDCWGHSVWDAFHSFISVTHSSVSLNNIPLCGYTTFCLSIHQLMDIWVVSTFWLLWIALLWTLLSKFWEGYMLSFLLSIFLEVEELGQVGRLWLTFWGTARLLYIGLYRLTFPPAVYEGSNFPTSSLAHVIVCLFDYSHIMVLICILLLTNNAEYLFTSLLAMCISSLEKCLFKSFSPFFSIGLSF